MDGFSTIGLIILGIIVFLPIFGMFTLIMTMWTDGWQFAYIYPKWAINEIGAYELDSGKYKCRFKIKKRELCYQIIAYRGILSALISRKFYSIDECEKFIMEQLDNRKKYLEKLQKFNNMEDLMKLEKLNKVLKETL